MSVILPGYNSYKYNSVDMEEGVTKDDDFNDLARLTILNTISNM